MVDASRLEIVFTNPLQIMEIAEPQPLGYVTISIWFGLFVITAKGDNVMFTLPVDYAVEMQVSYLDAHGNPATIDGEVMWESTDPSIIAVQIDPTDTTRCRLAAIGAVGQVQVTAKADADLGDGTRELVTLCDVEVIGGEAVAGTIEPVGAPAPITPGKDQRA